MTIKLTALIPVVSFVVAACLDEPPAVDVVEQCETVMGALCDVVESCEPSQGDPCRQYNREACATNERVMVEDQVAECIDELHELQCWPDHPLQALAIRSPSANQRACVEFFEVRP